MRKWTADTFETLDLRRPFLAYAESDISYLRHEPHIQAAYHVGTRLNKQVAIIGGQFHYFHNVHSWIYIDEIVAGEWMPAESEDGAA